MQASSKSVSGELLPVKNSHFRLAIGEASQASSLNEKSCAIHSTNARTCGDKCRFDGYKTETCFAGTTSP